MRELSRLVRATFLDFHELSSENKLLLEIAGKARLNAQAPYSRYLVGAAVRSEKQTIHIGCNVERCSWTQTTHAEQAGVDAMIAALGPTKIRAVAIVGEPADRIVAFPPERTGVPITDIEKVPVSCGHCLQIIWENCFNDPGVELISLCGNGEIAITTIGDVFPMRFGPNDLGIQYGK
ncbi:MAG: hypothetical protein AAB617_02250 [Patescibacteria group bacterium]